MLNVFHLCFVIQCVHAGALKAYEQSLVSAPECSTVLCNEAAALAKLERHADAVAAAKQALKLNSEYDKVIGRFATATLCPKPLKLSCECRHRGGCMTAKLH